ncbi:MAG: toxin-antitoxin system YwqK family antitoxin [Bacteroidota bacterium]|nr:MAG: toxin-antitoxin system YwqK family antitoxin [Bacteroidota bacterium]
MMKYFFLIPIVLNLFLVLGCSCQNRPGNEIDNQKNGTFQEFYVSGKIMEIANYKNNELEGWQISFYENGRVANAFYIHNGSIIGEAKKWYENGTLRKIEYYLSEMRNDSIIRVWYDNGCKRLEGQYKLGKKQGVWIQYYNTGDTALVRHYAINGEPDGVWRFYRSNGELEKEIDFNLDQSRSIVVFPYRSIDGEVFFPED